jgi:hypothetical protein
MGKRFYYNMPPVVAMQALNQLDDDMQQSSATALGAGVAAAASASLAAGSATAAGASRDAAIAAWQASTAPAEQLAAFSQSIHSGAIVKALLYDVAKDSDGGAWIKRCQHTSWYTEAIQTGKWLGQQATGSGTAIAAAGGVPGDYFQYTSDGKFYKVVSTVGAGTFTEVFRGSSREFPALSAIIAETGRVIIYDLTKPGAPMWMVLVRGATNRGWTSATSVAALNGTVIVGSNTGATGEVLGYDFAADRAWQRTNGASGSGYLTPAQISFRNSAAGVVTGSLASIVSSSVNDVAATVLPGAPADPATGLPVPTIAVATAGGVSVIKSDGTVYNWITNVGGIYSVSIDSQGRLCAVGGISVNCRVWFKNSLPTTSPDNTSDFVYSKGTIPARLGEDATTGVLVNQVALRNQYAFGQSNGGVNPLILFKPNPASYAKSMQALISNAYNTGWMVGDIRGAYLADTVVETVSGANLLTGDDANYSATKGSWTSQASATSTWDATNGVGGTGAVALTSIVGSNFYSALPLSGLTVGRSYTITFSGKNASSASASSNFHVSTGIYNGGTNLSAKAITFTTTHSTSSISFVASATTCYFGAFVLGGSGEALYLDNIQVQLAVDDRSVKAKPLTVNGSLTKAAVAAGSQLVGYSGFSATNFLEQPYNSDLDFGTGDFCVMGWAYTPSTASNGAPIFSRSTPSTLGPTIALAAGGSSGNVIAYVSATGYNSSLSAGGIAPNTWSHITLLRRSGTVELWVNGVLAASRASDTTNLTNTTATTRIGQYHTGGFDSGSVTLVRASASAPSADQIAQIYRDELALFQPGAQCTLDGTSSAVTALAYDDSTELLHAGTSWGRSALHGLVRIESGATTIGALTSIAAGSGAHISGGASAGRYAQPALTLRDELKRKAEAARATGQIPTPFWFTGDGTTAAFVLPYGYQPVDGGVTVQGLVMREGGTFDYTTTFDGYRWTVTFITVPKLTYNICIKGVRNG